MDTNDPVAAQRIELAKEILDDHATLAISGCASGRPWIARVFFVEDEPRSGSLDLCLCLALGPKKASALEAEPRVAFVVGGDRPDRWIQGTGTVELVDDESDSSANLKRIAEKSPDATDFLSRVDWTAVRVHVDRMRVTDLGSDPPITEFTFA